jgi:hypothetical protein
MPAFAGMTSQADADLRGRLDSNVGSICSCLVSSRDGYLGASIPAAASVIGVGLTP